jgi:hypothetical protein
MKHPRRQSKRHKTEPGPAILSRSDKLQIWGTIAFIVFGLIGVLSIRIRHGQRAFDESLTRTLNRWRPLYHLDDALVNRIREIENAFHGNGNFLTQPTRTQDETEQHHRELAAVMKPEDAERFLADQGRRPATSRH